MNPYLIIEKYYDKGSKLYQILINHSEAVRDKALLLAASHPELNIDTTFVSEAAMLHDIGIFKTYAPSISCIGTRPYIEHGHIGAEILRHEGFAKHARVCERHTGTGLTEKTIIEKGINIPLQDYTPQSIEEELICYADKFFSKTRLNSQDSLERIIEKMKKHNDPGIEKFYSWHEKFEHKNK